MKIQKKVSKQVIKFLKHKGTNLKFSETNYVVMINMDTHSTVTVRTKEEEVEIRYLSKKKNCFTLTASPDNKHISHLQKVIQKRLRKQGISAPLAPSLQGLKNKEVQGA